MEERHAGTVDQRADEPNRCSSDVVIWRNRDTLSTEVGSCSYGNGTLATICCW